MDAREKWVKAAEELADQMSFSDSCSLLYSGTKGVNYEVEFMTKRAELFAHLRTTPEGFALVPVPEWVPVGERLPVVPNGEDYAEVWVVVRGEVREDAFGQQISEDGMSLECGSGFCSDGVTHWKYKYTPAPPKSESL
mgnify:FL=1